MEALLTMLLSEKMGNDLVGAAAVRAAQGEAMRKKIRDGMSEARRLGTADGDEHVVRHRGRPGASDLPPAASSKGWLREADRLWVGLAVVVIWALDQTWVRTHPGATSLLGREGPLSMMILAVHGRHGALVVPFRFSGSACEGGAVGRGEPRFFADPPTPSKRRPTRSWSASRR